MKACFYKILLLSIAIALLIPLFAGCVTKESSNDEPPSHQAVAALPAETTLIQASPSPRVAILGSPEVTMTPSPVPSPSSTPDFGSVVTQTVEEQAIKTNAKHVDLVLCLDVSGSMDPLIDAARKKLLGIANNIKNLEQKPSLRIALISYGCTTYERSNGWVRIDTDFTESMEQVQGKLSALRSNGGSEFVARVIYAALKQLHWSAQPDTLRTIFIAGNEEVNQDPEIEISTICQEAVAKGMIINTIFCGYSNDPSSTQWKDLAKSGGGKSSEIALTGNPFGQGIPIQLPSGFPLTLPSGFPTQLPIPLPTSAPVAVKTPTKQASPRETGLDSFKGQIVGIVNGNELLIKDPYFGGKNESFKTDSKTAYEPPAWRPSSGDQVIVYYKASQPGKIREIHSLK